MTALATTVDRNHYEILKERFRRGLLDAGEALLEIRDKALYKVEYPTFEEFCRREIHSSARHVYRLIEAELTLQALPPATRKHITTESQARELAAVPEQRRPYVAERAVQTAPRNDCGRPVLTARHLRKTIEAEAAAAAAEPEIVITDELGNALEGDVARDFEDGTIGEAVRVLRQVRRLIRENADRRPLAHLRRQRIEADLHNAITALKFAKPYALCPYCNVEEGCRACHGQRWVPKSVFEQAPAEMQRMRRRSDEHAA